ncbi:hypothetical protein SERLADRAFT_440165 [Serpula lacrymans var. lacrymans S7.9]|uniref:Uncharacterized protein n=1 Tax=Serpula lacrymans var. lacrymans (strain S7.9) TaxID=578457 RepID=F8P3P8_SERL9|nr:uncharacterized protein SERLADRAFT_440165 [Serpula lacrymans var. lacrymans S7.9]EGO22147.1 hypothetical protein SERLADRAFT_440165 [Serpula lacrymans var. lacrymans S7.9]
MPPPNCTVTQRHFADVGPVLALVLADFGHRALQYWTTHVTIQSYKAYTSGNLGGARPKRLVTRLTTWGIWCFLLSYHRRLDKLNNFNSYASRITGDTIVGILLAAPVTRYNQRDWAALSFCVALQPRFMIGNTTQTPITAIGFFHD